MRWQDELATGDNIINRRLDDMTETAAERKKRLNRERQAAYKERQSERGLVRVEVQVAHDQVDRLHKYVARISREWPDPPTV